MGRKNQRIKLQIFYIKGEEDVLDDLVARWSATSVSSRLVQVLVLPSSYPSDFECLERTKLCLHRRTTVPAVRRISFLSINFGKPPPTPFGFRIKAQTYSCDYASSRIPVQVDTVK